MGVLENVNAIKESLLNSKNLVNDILDLLNLSEYKSTYFTADELQGSLELIKENIITLTSGESNANNILELEIDEIRYLPEDDNLYLKFNIVNYDYNDCYINLNNTKFKLSNASLRNQANILPQYIKQNINLFGITGLFTGDM